MLNLPAGTEIKRIIPKKTLYPLMKLNAADRESFDSDVVQVTLRNRISADTVAVSAGNSFTSFYVAEILLKRDFFNPKWIEVLSHSIPHKMIFVMRFDNFIRVGVFEGILFLTDKMPEGDFSLKIDGLDLDSVWGNAVKSLGVGVWNADAGFEENIELNKMRADILKKIEVLDKKKINEIQPKKKLALHKEIVELRAKLNSIDC